MAEIVENNVSADGAPGILSFVLNGKEVTVEGDHECSLLDILRDRCGVISPKNGCAPMAQCGCCTVLVDGRPKLSCGLKASRVAGKTVTTVEGLSGELREQVAGSFVRAGGVQCGFCIPGIVVRAVALLERNPEPSREQIANSLKSHLCRCTGYTKILDAIELLARVRRGESLPRGETLPRGATGGLSASVHPPDLQSTGRPAASGTPTGGVGTRLDRYNARQLVLGDFKYIDDITIEGSLYAAMRFSDHPRALVKSIDVEPALAHPGVARVVTAADVPGQRHVGLITPDWPILVAVGEETRYVGDILAIAVADDQLAARDAAARIAVDYEVREPITTPEDALEPDAPRIHPNGNLLSRSAICRGDVEDALAASTYVVEGHYSTQMIEHMFLEPEACIAIPMTAANGAGTLPSRGLQSARTPHLGDRQTASASDSRVALKVLTQGQGVFDDRRQIAAVLGWDEDRLYVELVSNGGAFGGKEDMSIQAQTALAAVLCDKPVKCTLTREESFRLHPKRHPVRMHLKVGCDAEGRLTALWSRIIGDKGAYASVGAKVLERAAGHAAGPYRFPNVDIESKAVYTNNPPCGAMRGFGANQSAFAIERALDRLAKQVGIDGWEMRWRNVLDLGDRFCTGQRLTKPFGLKKTLLAVRDQYRAAKYAGIACGIKNVGIGNGMPDRGKAVLTVEAADRVTIKTGFTEMGQGYFTICIQTACQETGLPPEVFEPLTDTSAEVDCGQTTASRATVLGGLAIIEAAKKLKADLDQCSALSSQPSALSTQSSALSTQSSVLSPQSPVLSPQSPVLSPQSSALSPLIGRQYRGDYACIYTDKLGADVPDPKTHLTYGFATQVVILDDEGRLKKVIAAHDVGKVMNPTLLEGQMEGSIHMGLGYALTEDFVVEGGRIQSKDVMSLGVLRAHQMPEIETIFIEEPDPETAYGARGVGEIGLVPTAPAVAGALEAFDGIHRTQLPMKDSPAAQALLGVKRR